MACFMLDGKCGMSLDAGRTWQPFKDVGRNWDYAAVDWTAEEPQVDLCRPPRVRRRNLRLHRRRRYLDACSPRTRPSTPRASRRRRCQHLPHQQRRRPPPLHRPGQDLDQGQRLHPRLARHADPQRRPLFLRHQPHRPRRHQEAKTRHLRILPHRLQRQRPNLDQQGAINRRRLGPLFRQGRETPHHRRQKIHDPRIHRRRPNLERSHRPPQKGFDTNRQGWFTNIAYDPKSDIFYISRMGQPAFKYERK